MKRFGMFVGIILALFVLYSGVQAQTAGVPQLINYQGYLTDKDGNPLTPGEYDLSFSIYADTSTKTAVWGPQKFDGVQGPGHGSKVPVVRGYFNVILGPIDTNSVSIDKAFSASNRFLEITVGTSTISPRQQILSTPYALNAQKSYGEVPVGGIVPYFGKLNALPANWKFCDGTTVNDPESPLINQTIPDLRTRFPRGASTADVFGYGGADTHTHYNSFSNVSVYIPVKSLTNWNNYAYQKASKAQEFFPNIYCLTFDGNQEGVKDAHAHSDGYAYGFTNSSSNVPAYYAINYIIRIK
ncbi:MAG: hypothetical protein U0586_12810 [Candidatus Brocadiaceae bacterium]